jgi:hypothetical protein
MENENTTSKDNNSAESNAEKSIPSGGVFDLENTNQTKKDAKSTSFSSYEDIIKPKKVVTKEKKPELTDTSSTVSVRPIIRTYKSDVEETVKTNHLSSINMAISENARMLKRVANGENKIPEGKKNKNILIISLILLFGGMLAFLIPYLLVNKDTDPVDIEIFNSETIITPDIDERIRLVDLNLNRVNYTLAERIEQSSTRLGQIKVFYLMESINQMEKTISAIDFLNLMRASVPANIVRTIKEPFTFGMHNFNGNQKFIILKVGAYDITYSGMLSWEETLWQDFKVLFELQETEPSIDDEQSENQISDFVIDVKKFQDATFSNKDARVVKDYDGNIVFLYSIIDDDTIVITTSIDTLREIITRITRARIITQ